MLLLVLLSAALVDLIAAIGTIATDQLNQHLLGPAKKPSRWQTIVSDATPAPNASRRLNLQLHARTLDASYELTLPAGHPLVHAVERGDAEADPTAFVNDVLGQVQIGELPWWPRSSTRSLVFDALPFDPPTVEIQEKDNQAVIRLNSGTWNVDLQRVRVTVSAPTAPLVLGTDVVTAQLDPSTEARLLIDQTNLPAKPVDGHTELNRLASAHPVTFTIIRTDQESLRLQALRILNTKLPILDWFLWRLAFTLPYVLFLLFLRREPMSRLEITPSLVSLTTLLLAFRLGAAVIGLVGELGFSIGPYTRPLAHYLTGHNPSHGAPTQAGAFGLALLAATILWPLAVLRALRRSAANPNPATNLLHAGNFLVSALIGLAAAAIFANGLRSSGHDVASRPLATAVVAAAAAILFWLLLLLLRALYGDRNLTLWAMIATCLLLLTARFHQLLIYRFTDQTGAIRVAVTLAAMAVMTGAYGLLLFNAGRFFTRRGPHDPRANATGLLLLALLVLAVVPDGIALALHPLPDTELGPWSLVSLNDWINSISDFLLLAGLLLCLKRLSAAAAGTRWPTAVRQAGVIVVIATFYWFSERWLYVPVSVLLGWLMAAWFLLPPHQARQVARASTRLIQPREAIERAIYLNGERSTQRTALGNLRKQLHKGEITYEEYADQVATIERRAGDQPSLAEDAATAKQLVLSLSTDNGGWANGKRTAMQGLILGIPWLLLELWWIAARGAHTTDYPALEFIGGDLWSLVQWPLYGFVLGYFYPFIRGHNGVQKGLCLFLTIVLPPLPFHLLWGQPDSLRAYGLFALRVFVFAVLMGLIAGDYQVLRRAGYRWQHLIEVHNLGFLILWGSSITVAIGAAIATILTTGIGSLAQFALEQVGLGGSPTPPGPSP